MNSSVASLRQLSGMIPESLSGQIPDSVADLIGIRTSLRAAGALGRWLRHREEQMAIPDYDGETFVAYADISGFKEMMKHDEDAVHALDHFYTAGYSILQEHPGVHGVFVSDCAVLFVNNAQASQEQLGMLLTVVESLNLALLRHNTMLKTSIARGRFSYHQRLEFRGIEKNPVYGNAYVAAFLDNESVQPRLQPGQCRVVKRGLEPIQEGRFPRLVDERHHLYFYWMVEERDRIESFNQRYADGELSQFFRPIGFGRTKEYGPVHAA